MNKTKVILIVWALIIVIISIIPNINTTQELTLGINFKIRFDYIAHLLMFAALTYIFFLYIYTTNKARHYKAIIFYILLGLIYAGICEYIQQLIPGRAFNINDFFYNAIGVVMGTIISVPLMEYRLKKKVLKSGN